MEFLGYERPDGSVGVRNDVLTKSGPLLEDRLQRHRHQC
jgi:hypothetical protein